MNWLVMVIVIWGRVLSMVGILRNSTGCRYYEMWELTVPIIEYSKRFAQGFIISWDWNKKRRRPSGKEAASSVELMCECLN